MSEKETLEKLEKIIKDYEDGLIATGSYEFYKEHQMIEEKLELFKSVFNLIIQKQEEIEEKNIAINKQSITISKQLQEIQELKEENKYQSLLISPYYVAQNYISKSKIKEINENTDTYYEFHNEVMKLTESEK